MSADAQPGEAIGHYLVDDQWIMVYRTTDGRVVDGDGSGVAHDEFEPEPYLRTIVVDGERYHERVSGLDGMTTWYDEDGNEAQIASENAVLLQPPGTAVIHDGELYRTYPGPDGVDVVVDRDGAISDISPGELRDECDTPTFASLAEYQGRRAVVGIDGDGNTSIYTLRGEPVPGPIRWADVERVDAPPPSGDPIGIGTYRFADGSEHQVLLFPSGAQAIENADGSYERVIVPTDVEYPEGRPFFEGNFAVGVGGDDQGALEVFSFRDGQTAYRVDGELVLMDLPLETHYPTGPPVHCGTFPGGELYVFPSGDQVVLRADGTFAIGAIPHLPPYDELVELYGDEGEVELPLDGAPPGAIPRFDGLFDDITELPGLPDVTEPFGDDDETAAGDFESPSPDEPTIEADPDPFVAPPIDPGIDPGIDVGISGLLPELDLGVGDLAPVEGDSTAETADDELLDDA